MGYIPMSLSTLVLAFALINAGFHLAYFLYYCYRTIKRKDTTMTIQVDDNGQPLVAALQFPVYRLSEFDWKNWTPASRFYYTQFIGIDDTATPVVYSLRYCVPGVVGGVGQVSSTTLEDFQAEIADVLARQDQIDLDVVDLLEQVNALLAAAQDVAAQAQSSATTAAQAAATATDAIAKSQTWAEGEDEAVAELGGVHSSKGWAAEAESHATDANTSATTAAEEATQAADSASAALKSATSAQTSAAVASSAKMEAEQYKTDAHDSAQEASEYASEASSTLSQVNTAGSTAISLIQTAQSTATDAIGTAQANAVSAVTVAQGDATLAISQAEAEAESDFDAHAAQKTTDFDSVVELRTNQFNDNAETKTTNFDVHVVEKTTEFDNSVEQAKTDLAATVTASQAQVQAVADTAVNDIQITSEAATSQIGAATNAMASEVTKAETWAEGSDDSVSILGGEHSAKGWADIASQVVAQVASNAVPIGTTVRGAPITLQNTPGVVLKDGSTYTKEQFPDFYENYLLPEHTSYVSKIQQEECVNCTVTDSYVTVPAADVEGPAYKIQLPVGFNDSGLQDGKLPFAYTTLVLRYRVPLAGTTPTNVVLFSSPAWNFFCGIFTGSHNSHKFIYGAYGIQPGTENEVDNWGTKINLSTDGLTDDEQDCYVTVIITLSNGYLSLRISASASAYSASYTAMELDVPFSDFNTDLGSILSQTTKQTGEFQLTYNQFRLDLNASSITVYAEDGNSDNLKFQTTTTRGGIKVAITTDSQYNLMVGATGSCNAFVVDTDAETFKVPTVVHSQRAFYDTGISGGDSGILQYEGGKCIQWGYFVGDGSTVQTISFHKTFLGQPNVVTQPCGKTTSSQVSGGALNITSVPFNITTSGFDIVGSTVGQLWIAVGQRNNFEGQLDTFDAEGIVLANRLIQQSREVVTTLTPGDYETGYRLLSVRPLYKINNPTSSTATSTIQAGSIITSLTGVQKTITADLIMDKTYAGNIRNQYAYAIPYTDTTYIVFPQGACKSGSGAPTHTNTAYTYLLYLDTDANKYYRSDDSGTTWVEWTTLQYLPAGRGRLFYYFGSTRFRDIVVMDPIGHFDRYIFLLPNAVSVRVRTYTRSASPTFTGTFMDYAVDSLIRYTLETTDNGGVIMLQIAFITFTYSYYPKLVYTSHYRIGDSSISEGSRADDIVFFDVSNQIVRQTASNTDTLGSLINAVRLCDIIDSIDGSTGALSRTFVMAGGGKINALDGSQIADCGLPTASAIPITYNGTGNYTMPASGWLNLQGRSTAPAQEGKYYMALLHNVTNSTQVAVCQPAGFAPRYASGMIPVRSGDIVTLTEDTNYDSTSGIFYLYLNKTIT